MINVSYSVTYSQSCLFLGFCRSWGRNFCRSPHYRIQRQERRLLLHPAEELLQPGMHHSFITSNILINIDFLILFFSFFPVRILFHSICLICTWLKTFRLTRRPGKPNSLSSSSSTTGRCPPFQPGHSRALPSRCQPPWWLLLQQPRRARLRISRFLFVKLSSPNYNEEEQFFDQDIKKVWKKIVKCVWRNRNVCELFKSASLIRQGNASMLSIAKHSVFPRPHVTLFKDVHINFFFFI